MEGINDINAGDDVTLHGKVKEIIISEKETLYRIIINRIDPPNTFSNEVLIRRKDIVE